MRKLKQLLFKARDRPGGRIYTNYRLGLDETYGCDTGGGWIHGVSRNPLTRLVQRLVCIFLFCF